MGNYCPIVYIYGELQRPRNKWDVWIQCARTCDCYSITVSGVPPYSIISVGGCVAIVLLVDENRVIVGDSIEVGLQHQFSTRRGVIGLIGVAVEEIWGGDAGISDGPG